MGALLKMFTGNPVTMVYVALGIAAVSYAAGGYSGWTLNGWRLGFELEHVKRERDTAVDQGVVLAEATKACSAGVTRVEKLSAAAMTQGEVLVAEARRLHAGGVVTAAKIENLLKQPTPAGADCNSAWKEIEKARAP